MPSNCNWCLGSGVLREIHISSPLTMFSSSVSPPSLWYQWWFLLPVISDGWSAWLQFIMDIYPSVLKSFHPIIYFRVSHTIKDSYIIYLLMNFRCCQKSNDWTYGLINIVFNIFNWHYHFSTGTVQHYIENDIIWHRSNAGISAYVNFNVSTTFNQLQRFRTYPMNNLHTQNILIDLPVKIFNT